MSNIIYYDSSGVPISHFYQWDSNQKINIVGDDVGYITEVHFCNIDSNEALVVIPEKADDGIIVDVPNILLQYQKPIIAYIFQDGENDGSRTIDSARIAVIPRAKPADYVYTETDVLCYRKLDERIKALEGADGKDYVLTEADKQEIADIVLGEQAIDQPLDPSVVDNTFLEWYSASNHAAGSYVQTYTNAKFKTHRYAVNAGTKYHLHGTAVRLFGNYPLAVFSAIETPTKTQPGVLILEATAAEQDFNTTYTPEQDGYIIVAVYTDYGQLGVSQVGGEVKKPLKIQIFGDSMSDKNWNAGGDTGATRWVDFLAEHLHGYDLDVVNSAVGGNTLVKYQPDASTGLYKGVAWQMTLTETTAGSPNSAGYDQYQPLLTDRDLIIVWAGCNEWGVPGLLDDRTSLNPTVPLADVDISKLYGAVRAIIETVSSKTSAKLLFVTPAQRYTEADSELSTNADGNPLRGWNGYLVPLVDHVDVIREACSFYGVPCLDVYREGSLNRYNVGAWTIDGLHANAAGAKLFAEKIAAAIENGVGSGGSYGYSKAQIDAALGAYITDVAALVGGDA